MDLNLNIKKISVLLLDIILPIFVSVVEVEQKDLVQPPWPLLFCLILHLFILLFTLHVSENIDL